MTGYAPGFKDVNDQTRKDLTKAELIAFPLLALLLLLVFRGVVAAAVPLLLGVLSIVGTLFVLRLMSTFVGTSLFALNIATALSLGLAVDYGLLMVSRYREEIAGGRSPEEAHRITVLTAGRTALFSGVTVAGAMVTLVLMPQRFLYSVGAAGAAVGILSAVSALFVVPALLSVLGPRINALSIRRPAKSVSDESDGWMRLARAVMRRPIARRAGDDGPAARPGRAVGRHDADRAERAGGLVRASVLRGDPVRAGPLPARHLRGGHGHRPRRGHAGRARGRPAPGAGGARRRARVGVRAAGRGRRLS